MIKKDEGGIDGGLIQSVYIYLYLCWSPLLGVNDRQEEVEKDAVRCAMLCGCWCIVTKRLR